ncbi:GRAM domain-containing protein [Salinibacter sp. 10B]|uniref:GRAM domain-containing protein n=1 Tax=Salinibacter sp. 10B TaxID=1923971 RepID=UPI0015E3FFD3|nr:GRAM domain-containing protein [Salinibacter sp. 10B]
MANRYVGTEAVGGRLFLTDQHVRFEPHSANVQTSTWKAPLSDIREVEATRTFGFLPNGVVLKLTSGEAEQFATWNRDAWCEAMRSFLDEREE